MSSKYTSILAIIATTLILSACTPTNTPETPETPESNTVETSETPTDDTDKETAIEPTETEAYTPYTEELYSSLVGKQAFALFFHAEWCPTCRQMEKEITANLSTLPEGTQILKADFDKESELKKEYGITSQSTVVIINAKGKAIKTLSAPTSTEIVEELSAL